MKKTILLLALACTSASMGQVFQSNFVSRYVDGRDGACEISTYDETSKKLFVTNAASDSVDIVSLQDINNPTKVGGIDVTLYGGGVNSVATLGNGYIAAAIEADVKQDSGSVVIFDLNGVFTTSVKVGSLPDMLTVTKDGKYIVVANEGEPNDDYTVDPAGSISIIDITGEIDEISSEDVTTLGFEDAPTIIEGALQKPGTTWAVDLEPEYVAIDDNSTTAVVICQESNVFIFVDLVTKSITSYKGLGFKDHSIEGNGIDASNRDDKINIQTWDVLGVYQPDAIAATIVDGETYYLSANEGDGRDYDGYSSETRIKDLTLDPTVFPNAETLQADENLGRLKTFTIDVIGDTDNDNDVDQLYSYGGRSFSIWDENGDLVWDSGDDFEQYIAANHSAFFNINDGTSDELDERSDDKGIEPEAVTVGKLGSQYFAFVGLERQGGVMVYDITTPTAPVFVEYINSINETSTTTDIAPEGIVFVSTSESEGLLMVSHEVSGTTVVYNVSNLVGGVFGSKNNNASIFAVPSVVSESFDIKGIDENVSLEIYNTTGSLVTSVKNGSTSVNVSDLVSGAYFVKVKEVNSNNELTTVRIIKK